MIRSKYHLLVTLWIVGCGQDGGDTTSGPGSDATAAATGTTDSGSTTATPTTTAEPGTTDVTAAPTTGDGATETDAGSTGSTGSTGPGTTGDTGEPVIDEDLPYGGRYYGVAANGRGPGNTRFATMAAHRVRAEKSGLVTMVRWNNRFDHDEGNVGYSIGDGGDVRVELRADDGTDKHFPVDAALAQTAVLEQMIKQPEYPLIEFIEPVWLDAGEIYHIVYVQLGEPGNEVSINDLHNLTYGEPRSPYFDDDFTTLIHNEGTGWAVRDRYIPLFELHYDDGIVKGQGFFGGRPEVDKPAGTVKTISGDRGARERISIEGPSRTARAVWLRLWRVEGDDPLQVCLRAEGQEVECLLVAAADVSKPVNDQNFDCRECSKCDDCSKCGGKDICSGCQACDDGTNVVAWFRVEFGQSHELTAGATYELELASPATTTYRTTAMLGLGHTNKDAERFTEDKQVLPWRAEYTVNGGADWTGWSDYGVDDRDDHHLGVLFELE